MYVLLQLHSRPQVDYLISNLGELLAAVCESEGIPFQLLHPVPKNSNRIEVENFIINCGYDVILYFSFVLNAADSISKLK